MHAPILYCTSPAHGRPCKVQRRRQNSVAQRISTSRAPIANLHAPAIQPQRRPPRACVCLLIAMCQARPRSASTLESWEVVRTAWRLIFGMKPLEPPFGSRGYHGPRVRSPRGATDLGFGTWDLGLGRRRGRGRGGCTASFSRFGAPARGAFALESGQSGGDCVTVSATGVRADTSREAHAREAAAAVRM